MKKDLNETAFSVLQQFLGEEPKSKEKNAAAQELGAKGGKRRAENLTAEQKSEIGKKGAKARWEKD